MSRLQDKTAVITGGTTGLGFETARRFVAEGARVIITGTSEERLKAAAAELGKDARCLVADVRRLDDLDRLAGFAADTFGSVNVVFANAGVGKFAPIDAVDAAFSTSSSTPTSRACSSRCRSCCRWSRTGRASS